MNGAGTGLQVSMMKIQKVATTQPVPRRALTALSAVVVGTTIRITVLFLAVLTATRSAASLAFVLCVPVLNKI